MAARLTLWVGERSRKLGKVSEGYWAWWWGERYAVHPALSHSMKFCLHSIWLRTLASWVQLSHQGDEVTNLNWMCNHNLGEIVHDWKTPWIKIYFQSPQLMGHHLACFTWATVLGGAVLATEWSPLLGERVNDDRGPEPDGPEGGSCGEFCLGSWRMLTSLRPKPQSPTGPGLETNTKS